MGMSHCLLLIMILNEHRTGQEVPVLLFPMTVVRHLNPTSEGTRIRGEGEIQLLIPSVPYSKGRGVPVSKKEGLWASLLCMPLSQISRKVRRPDLLGVAALQQWASFHLLHPVPCKAGFSHSQMLDKG